ncbi:MAG: alpha/beta fold hydrolase [Cystobacter sp.]
MSEASVHITRWGASGPRVVLVHGSIQGSRVGGELHFAAQERLVERGWRLVVPDRPGHGLSGDPGRPDDAEADGAWVADLLEDGAHLVGHSFGGCVALAAAARRPQAVRSLTLIEPALQNLAPKDWRVRRFVLRAAWTMLSSFSASSRTLRFFQLMRVPRETGSGAPTEELERMGRAMLRLKVPSPPVMRSQVETVRREGIPLLVVTGGWSPSLEVAADAAVALGGGQRKVIASEHHFPQSISDEFNQTLDAFMRASDARRAR